VAQLELSFKVLLIATKFTMFTIKLLVIAIIELVAFIEGHQKNHSNFLQEHSLVQRSSLSSLE
jgi:hypothetical protein